MADIIKDLGIGLESTNEIVDSSPVDIKEFDVKEENLGFVSKPLDKQANKVSSWEDNANIVNPLAIPFNNIELTKINTFRDDNFDVVDYVDNRKDLTEDEKILLFKRGLNKEYSDALIKKKRIYDDSLIKVREDDSATKYGKMLLTGVLDPTIIIPYTGAVRKVESVIKAQSMLGRMSTKFGTYGTIGATTNVASESLFELQGLPTDYKSAAMIGFVLGGGLPAIGEGFSFNIDSRKIAKNLLEQPQFERELDIDINTKQFLNENGEVSHVEFKDINEGLDKFYDDIALTEGDGGTIKKWGVGFMKSAGNRLHENSDKFIQGFVRKAVNATIGTKDETGKLIKVETNTHDDKINLRSKEFNFISKNSLAYRNAIKDGYFKGSFEDWNKQITNEMRLIESKRKKDIDAEYSLLINENKVDELEFDYDKVFKEELNSYIDNMINKAKKEGKNITSKDNLMKNESNIKKAKSNTDSKLNKLKEELVKKQDEKNLEIKKSLEKKYNYEYYSKDSKMKYATDNAKKYFDDMANYGKKIGNEDYAKLELNGAYTARIYDWNIIHKMDDTELKEIFRNGIINHPSERNKQLSQNTDELEEELNELVKAFKTNAQKSELAEAQYIGRRNDLDADNITNVNHFMKNRKYDFDDYSIRDVLESDIGLNIQKYHFRTSSELALFKNYGTSDTREILKKTMDRYKQNNPDLSTEKLIEVSKDVESVLDNLTGVSIMRTTIKNPNSMKVVRILGLFNTLTLGGKFGLNSINEIANALTATESKSIFIGKFGNNLKQITDIMSAKGSDSFSKEMMEMVGILPELTDSMASSKITDVDTYFSGSFLEKGLRKGVDKFMTYNGMKLITGYFQSVVASNAIKDVRKFAKILNEGGTLSGKQKMFINRWGMDDADVISMNKMIENHGEFEGSVIKKLNLSKWDDDSYVKMSTSIKRAVESGVLQGDSLHLPQWLIEGGPLTKLAFEFLRYPMIANEVLLRRGLTEDMAGFVSSAIGSIMVFSSVYYLKEQSEVALGITKENKMKYDIFNSEEDFKKLMLKSLNYVGAFGALTIPYDKLATLTGFPSFGREYADDISSLFGVSASRLGTLRQLIHGVLTGEIKDEQTLFALKSLLPMLSLPVLSDGLNTLIKKYGD